MWLTTAFKGPSSPSLLCLSEILILQLEKQAKLSVPLESHAKARLHVLRAKGRRLLAGPVFKCTSLFE